MNLKMIPVVPARPAAKAIPQTRGIEGEALDQFGRRFTDLRISVTDRCNFRCGYCMPREVFTADYPYLPRSSILSFEEITRVAAAAAAMGVRKFRLTGGEPLLRKDIESLIRMLSSLRTTENQKPDITLTTNGVLLTRKARELRAAGLDRVTVSLDAMSDANFRRMSDSDFSVQDVLDGIHHALDAGFRRVKVNMVVRKGWNEDEVIGMVSYFRQLPVALRFIEYMDVGASNGWNMQEVVSSNTLLEKIRQAGNTLLALPAESDSDTAIRWQHQDAPGEIGFISSISQPFCNSCSRLRLSTDGKIYTCLFASEGYDLRTLLQSGADKQALQEALTGIWQQRDDRYSAIRTEAGAGTRRERIEMSYIGG